MKVQIFLSTNDGTIFIFVIQKSPLIGEGFVRNNQQEPRLFQLV